MQILSILSNCDIGSIQNHVSYICISFRQMPIKESNLDIFEASLDRCAYTRIIDWK